METKAWYLSKTIWFGILTGIAAVLAPAIPEAKALVEGYLPALGVLWGVLAIVLRIVSKDKVVLREEA